MPQPETRGIFGADWTNIALGLVVVATPYLANESRQFPFWNSLLVGLVVAGLAAWNMAAARRGRAGQAVGTSTLNLLLGLWLVLAPFMYAGNTGYRWATVIEGIVLVFASGYVAWAAGRLRGAVERVT